MPPMRRIGQRRKGIRWEYNGDGQFPRERWSRFWKRYWRRWRRRNDQGAGDE
jgi:hypothetical protein